MYLTVCPLLGSGSITGHGRVFQGISARLIKFGQPSPSQHVWQKMAQSSHNDTTQPVDIDEKGH